MDDLITMGDTRKIIDIYSDCSGIHSLCFRKPVKFRLGFMLYDKEEDFILMRRCYEFSGRKFFNHHTDHAEALACLLAMYHFDQYFDIRSYRPIFHLDNGFVIKILEGDKKNKFIQEFSLTPEIRKYYEKFGKPVIFRVYDRENKAHDVARNCQVV